MATTIVPEFKGRITHTPEQIREFVRDLLVSAQGDMDKCGDMDDHNFYEGRVTALTDVLVNMLFPRTPEDMKVCIHNNPVWFGHECGECDTSPDGYVWKDDK